MKLRPRIYLGRLKVLIRANAFISDLSKFWDYGAVSKEADTLKPGLVIYRISVPKTVVPKIILDHMSSNYLTFIKFLFSAKNSSRYLYMH